MKRLIIAAVAAATAISPLAVSSASAQYRDRDRGDRYDNDRGDRYDRDDRRDRRSDRRRHHRGERWERNRHNGYYLGSRWYYGPPQASYYSRQDYRPSYRSWRRGDRLPGYYRTRYVVVNDYDRYHLRRPPRGYHYVRDDRGDIILAAIATGIILSVIANQ